MDLQKDWLVHHVGERVDSFNIGEFKRKIEALVETQTFIALELKDTNFLSITAIQLLAWWADRLCEKGGQMMLIAPTEKLKRQIAIFGSLDQMIVTKPQELQEAKSIFESPELDGTLDS